MKGITEIILTDQNGNEERFVEENMVTNAFASIYNGMPYGIRSTNHVLSNQNSGDLDKILTKTAGGLLCFPQAITEDADHLFETLENFPTGYASNDAYAGDDNRRGSFNATESGKVDGGYRFVFDFATNQANGLIRCLALTHYKGAKGYYADSKEYINSPQTGLSQANCGEIGHKIEEPNSSTRYAKYVVCWNDNKMLVVDQRRDVTSGGSIYEVPYKSNGINFDSYESSSQWVEKMPIPAGNIIKGKDFFYTVTATATAITYKKYNINCELIAEGTWNVPGVNLYTNNQQRGFAHDGANHIYYLNNNSTIVYKIDIDNLADVVAIPITWGKPSGTNYYYDDMSYIDGVVWMSNGIVGEDDQFYKSSTVVTILPFRRIGVWLIYFNENYGGSARERSHLWAAMNTQTNYLATINNLSGTGVTKTPDKTMKVIYTLYA